MNGYAHVLLHAMNQWVWPWSAKKWGSHGHPGSPTSYATALYDSWGKLTLILSSVGHSYFSCAYCYYHYVQAQTCFLYWSVNTTFVYKYKHVPLYWSVNTLSWDLYEVFFYHEYTWRQWWAGWTNQGSVSPQMFASTPSTDRSWHLDHHPERERERALKNRWFCLCVV